MERALRQEQRADRLALFSASVVPASALQSTATTQEFRRAGDCLCRAAMQQDSP
jgi:hypothetical protein